MSNTGFCEYLKEKVDANKLIKGVVGFNEDNTIIEGMFSPSFKTVVIQFDDGSTKNVMCREIIPQLYIETSTGVFKSQLTLDVINGFEPYFLTDQVKSRFEYSITSDRIAAREEFTSSFKANNDNVINYLKPIFNTFSIGIEFETASGLIPKDIQLESGLVPLRDGSIPGFEYVTVPLKGAVGAQMCINALSAIEEYTTTDVDTCALHFHFGGVPRTEGFIVALWRVISVYQNNLFELQPPYKMLNWGFKKKSYSKPYPASISAKLQFDASDKENFSHIFEYLSQGSPYSQYGSDLKNVHTHPSDPDGRHKWNINTRYSILNLVPLIFGNKQTVEFRLSEITNNKETVINELCMLASILKFTMINQKRINESYKFLHDVSFRDISEYTDIDRKMSDYIRNYISKKYSFVGRYFKYKSFNDFNMNDFRVEFPFPIETIPFDISKKTNVDYFNKYQNYETDVTCPIIRYQNNNAAMPNFMQDIVDADIRRNIRQIGIAPNNWLAPENRIPEYNTPSSRFHSFGAVNVYKIRGVNTNISSTSFSESIFGFIMNNLLRYKSAVATRPDFEQHHNMSELCYLGLSEIVGEYIENRRINTFLINSFVNEYLLDNEQLSFEIDTLFNKSMSQLINRNVAYIRHHPGNTTKFVLVDGPDRGDVLRELTLSLTDKRDVSVIELMIISMHIIGIPLFEEFNVLNDDFSEKLSIIHRNRRSLVDCMDTCKNVTLLETQTDCNWGMVRALITNKFMNNAFINIIKPIKTR